MDERLDGLRRWLTETLGHPPDDLHAISADASFRRYFRLSDAGRSRVAMDAPPERERSEPFVKVAGLMREAGVNAPQVMAADLERGYLLLTDLGDTLYLDALDERNADALFDDALEALIRWQLASRPDVLPPFDRVRLQAELDLFADWYVARHLDVVLSVAERETWTRVCELLIDAALAQPRVFVHRDYMPRNLMVAEPNPGVIDFQDAAHGPVSYDAVSLFRDAFISWDEARVEDWARRYRDRAEARGVPVPAEPARFLRDFDWMGVQRHLKVLGIFARLNYRDGKPHYLADTPRFLSYLRDVAGRYTELAPLLKLIDGLVARSRGGRA